MFSRASLARNSFILYFLVILYIYCLLTISVILVHFSTGNFFIKKAPCGVEELLIQYFANRYKQYNDYQQSTHSCPPYSKFGSCKAVLIISKKLELSPAILIQDLFTIRFHLYYIIFLKKCKYDIFCK